MSLILLLKVNDKKKSIIRHLVVKLAQGTMVV